MSPVKVVTTMDAQQIWQHHKEAMMKQLIKFPDLYYAKSHFPLDISQRAINHLWRVCESYELWCNETKNTKLIKLNIIE